MESPLTNAAVFQKQHPLPAGRHFFKCKRYIQRRPQTGSAMWKKFFRRTAECLANAYYCGHQNIDFASLNSLNIAEAQICQFRKPLLGHPLKIALAANICPKRLLEREQLSWCRHAILRANFSLDFNAVLRRSLRCQPNPGPSPI